MLALVVSFLETPFLDMGRGDRVDFTRFRRRYLASARSRSKSSK
jgi:hypothetical protein